MNTSIFIAEIGINHNGEMSKVCSLINLAKKHRFDYVKFQKRDIESCYSKEYLDSPRESIWGTTQRDQKLGLELSINDYKYINYYCKLVGIDWYYSPWDVVSAELMLQFNTDYVKIARACVTNKKLQDFYNKDHPEIELVVSTNFDSGDSQYTIDSFNNISYLLNCVSLYPTPENFNGLSSIIIMKELYDKKIGYSNHSSNWIHPTIASYLGAEMVEVHITLDKNMPGSDQKASLDDADLTNMMKYRYNELSISEVDTYLLKENEVLKKLRQTW